MGTLFATQSSLTLGFERLETSLDSSESKIRANNHYDTKVIDSLTWISKQSGTASATAHSDLVDPATSMRIIFGNGGEQPMVRATTSNGRALYTFTSRDIKKYRSATIRSYIDNVLVLGPFVSSTDTGG